MRKGCLTVGCALVLPGPAAHVSNVPHRCTRLRLEADQAVDQILERSRERIGRQLAQVCDGVGASALEPLQREFEALVVHASVEVQRAEERRQPGGLCGLADLLGRL